MGDEQPDRRPGRASPRRSQSRASSQRTPSPGRSAARQPVAQGSSRRPGRPRRGDEQDERTEQRAGPSASTRRGPRRRTTPTRPIADRRGRRHEQRRGRNSAADRVEPRSRTGPGATIVASVIDAQRSSTTPRSCSHSVRSRGGPRRARCDGSGARTGRSGEPSRDTAGRRGHRQPIVAIEWTGDTHPSGLSRTAIRLRLRATARLYSAAISSLHTRYAFRQPEVHLVVGLVADRRRSPCPAHRHGAARPEGPGPRRLRRDLDLAEPAARLPDRPGPRRGPDGRGHRRQPLPRLRRRHRGQLDRPRAPAGRRRDQGAGRRADPLLGVRLLPADLPARSAASSPRSRRSPAAARAYLGNSGTEVVEASIKLARFATKRPYIVAFLGAFHGRTYGSVSLTASKAKYHAGFGPLLPGVFHAPFGRVEDLRWFDEVLFDKLAPAERGRGDHRRADPGRGRLHRPRGRLPPGPPRDLRRARDPAHRRRDPVGRRADRARCGRSSTGASSPTSC